MAKRSGGGAFFFGSVIGGAVGSLVTLWSTPQSGQELRRKLGIDQAVSTVSSAMPSGGDTTSAGSTATGTSFGSGSAPLSARLLAPVERVVAPLVGVKLGQTANNSQPGYTGPATPASSTVSTETTDVSSGLVPPTPGVPVMPIGSK